MLYSRLRKRYNSLLYEAKENVIAYSKVIGAAEQFINLRDGIDDVAKASSPSNKLKNLHQLMEDQHVWQKKYDNKEGQALLNDVFKDAEALLEDAEVLLKAKPVIKSLQSRIDHFMGELNVLGMGEEYETKIRTDLLGLSFMMMDVIESINNSNFIPSHQGINLQLLMEEITSEEASQMAQPVTDDERETSQWPRMLHKCLTKWAGTARQPLVEQKTLLLNGYKFEFLKGIN